MKKDFELSVIGFLRAGVCEVRLVSGLMSAAGLLEKPEWVLLDVRGGEYLLGRREAESF